ncbi:hypothetical protein [Nocardioides sp.]|uniref:hypothetical protein n=1 Tax=Nocardioides sp. TaxID=35761 RepID=UPI002B26B80A|nr:hypothetical protein [Nocardioides sp.]
MSIFRKAGTTAALSVAGVGIAVGGVGLAGATDGASGQDTSESASAPDEARGQGQGDRRGHGHGSRGGSRSGISAGLSEALDLDESDVDAALSAVREQLSTDDDSSGQDGERTRPTEAGRAERQEQWASALADELGVTEQQVTAALESLSEARAEAGRASLSERLDDAVTDGDLTAADRASVLKAFDAGVLGGHRGR